MADNNEILYGVLPNMRFMLPVVNREFFMQRCAAVNILNWQHETYWLHYLCARGDFYEIEANLWRLAGGGNEVERLDIERRLNDDGIRDFNYGGCLHTAVAWNNSIELVQLLVSWGADTELLNMQGDDPADSIHDTLYVNPFEHIIGDGEFIPVHRFRRREDDFVDAIHYLDDEAEDESEDEEEDEEDDEEDDMPNLIIEMDDEDDEDREHRLADEELSEPEEEDEEEEEENEDGGEEVPAVRRRLDFGEDERIEQLNNPEAFGEMVVDFNEEGGVGWVIGGWDDDTPWTDETNNPQPQGEWGEWGQWQGGAGAGVGAEVGAGERELTEEEADRRGDNDYIPPENWPADRMYSEEEEREFNGSPLRLDADENPPSQVRRGLGLTAEDRAAFVWGQHEGREDSDGEDSDGEDSDREEIHYIPDPDEGMIEAAEYVPLAFRSRPDWQGGPHTVRVANDVPDTFNDVSDSNDAVDPDQTPEEEVPDVEETSGSSTDTGDELMEEALNRYHVVSDYIIDPIRNWLSS